MGIFSALSNLFFGSGSTDNKFSIGGTATINSQAILPNDRSTPGLFTASDMVRTWQDQGLMLSSEQVEQSAMLAKVAKQQAMNSKKFAENIKSLATSESEIVANFSDAKGHIARENFNQHKSHNRLYNHLDKVAGKYFLESKKREQQSRELQQKINMQLSALEQKQTQKRQLSGW